MQDYPNQIEKFIAQNFEPSNPENCNVKFTNDAFFVLLFSVFPHDCISDYELNDILIKLNYQRFTYIFEQYIEVGKGKEKVFEIHKSLQLGWCMKSYLDLHIEEVEKQ
jgi:hypothetical protein